MVHYVFGACICSSGWLNHRGLKSWSETLKALRGQTQLHPLLSTADCSYALRITRVLKVERRSDGIDLVELARDLTRVLGP